MPSLKEEAVHGVKWTGIATAVTTVLLLGNLAVLANLLSPTDFGLMGMMMVIVGFAQAFADMGVSNAIIYRQDATRDQLSSLYWLNIMAGIVVFGIVVAATPLIVRFYHEPRLSNLVYWTALVFLITPIGQQFQVLLQKNMRFNRLAFVEMSAALVGAAVAISTAFLGCGVMALVWGLISSAACKTLLLVREGWSDWRPRMHFRRKDLKGYLSFGLYQMGDRSLDFYNANVDYLLIGRFLGANALGIYTLAYQLVVMPLLKLNPVVTRVAFPLFARKQKDDRMLRRGYLELSKMIAFVIFPILVGMAVTAPVFVPVIFGVKWTPAVALIQVFVILGMLKSLTNPAGSIFLAKGRADIGFKWSLFVAFIATGLFLVVVKKGIYAMAWAWVLLVCLFFPIILWLLHRLIRLSPWQYFAAIWRPVALSIVMGGIMYSGYLLLSGLIHSELGLFIGLVICGVVVYGLAIGLFEREYFREYWGLLIRRSKEAD